MRSQLIQQDNYYDILHFFVRKVTYQIISRKGHPQEPFYNSWEGHINLNINIRRLL
jgi:hypothetical protein